MTAVLRAQPVDAKTAEWLLANASLEEALARIPRPLHHSKPTELDLEVVAAVCAIVPSLRPEDAALLDALDVTRGPSLVTVRRARRLAGLFRFLELRALRDAMHSGPLASRDAKAISAELTKLRKLFADCGLHQWGLVLEHAVATVKKPSPQDQLKAEIARLRALLERHGIDPDADG